MPEIGASHKLTHQDGGNDEISALGLSGLLGDSQTPLAHKTSHQNTGTDEISVAGLAGHTVCVPYNGKIADITHPDTGHHYLDLATALSETRKIISINLFPERISGSGYMAFYPNEGSIGIGVGSWDEAPFFVIKDGSQRLEYLLSAANDDWDLYCTGYEVVGA